FFLGYKPQNTYTYCYEACVTSGFPETEQQLAGLKISCYAEVYVESDSSAYLKIKKPLLYEVNGTSCSFDSLKISPVSADLTPLLEEPIKFDFKAGKVGKIYCKENEPEYILNIKRGILAMFHHNFTKPDPADKYDPRMYKNWEYGAHGLCENLYDVEYQFSQETHKTQAMKLSKTLNLNNCTGKPHVFSNIPGVRCLSKSCDRVEEPLKISISSSCNILGQESKFVVKTCETTGEYIFAPNQMKGTAVTTVKQNLKFKEVKAGLEQYSIPTANPRTLEMTGYDDHTVLTEKQKTEFVTKTLKMIDLLIKSVEKKDWKAYIFTSLVELLRKADEDTLSQIWDHCSSDEQRRPWLLEALPFVYKQEVFKLIKEKILSKDLKVNEAVPVLRGLALTTNPTEPMCRDISNVCFHSDVQENEALKKTCYLTLGALLYEHSKIAKSPKLLHDIALELKNRLRIADYQEKIIIVKTMGNFGHKTLDQPLLDIIQDNNNKLELRVSAVYALRRIAPQIPQKVLPVLLQIFRQVDTDGELRMACFVVICDTKPGPAVFNMIVKHLYYERTNHVRSFVVSYIRGMTKSRYPCDEKMAKTARFALKMLRTRFALQRLRVGKIDFHSSKWLHLGEYSEPLQLGGSFDFQMVSTPSSFIPRAINSKVNLHILGKSLNLFETGVRGEGIQELVKRLVGPKGHYSGKNKLFDKEIREIKKMLPITELEGEKTKGSFYFKVLGKELMYNYFTYEDVKELIEDGVIRVDNNLKDILKKGKKMNLTKVMIPVEIKVVQPSCMGIPLKFTLQSVLFIRLNTTIKAEVEPKFFFPLPDQLTLNGKINVSILHSTWGKMKICLPQLETGSKMKLNVNVTTGVSGRLQCKIKDHSYTTEIDLPQHQQQILSTDKQGYTFLMYTKPVKGSKDWQSLYRSTKLDGFEIGEVAQVLYIIGRRHDPGHHRYANWTLKAASGKYLSVNEQNELILSDQPTIFKVFFVGRSRAFVKLYVSGKGFVKVKPDSKGCLETVKDRRYPKLFKISPVKGTRHVRLATVVFIHPTDKSKTPIEWTKTTAPMNTDKVVLFKHLIEDMKPETGYEEKWRYLSDDIPSGLDGFHPRHMKLVFITPVEGKVCLRPNKTDETVFTVKRHHTNTSEVCYGEQIIGMEVCLSGEHIQPSVPHPPVFPFGGPTNFNISLKPGKNPARAIQFKFGRRERYDDEFKSWKAGMYLLGTKPEKKVEARISYDVINKKSDIIVDVHNMLPWLKKVCITSHVIKDDEAWFYLKFGKNCSEYQVRSAFTIKEPGRREVEVVTVYNQLPYSVVKIFYQLFLTFTRRYRDRRKEGAVKTWFSFHRLDYQIKKFKTEQLVDLELIMPSRKLMMNDVRIKTHGFIPHGNPMMQLVIVLLFPAVCTVDHDSFRTFDDVEFQYSLPDRCVHVLTKDCTKNNSFLVLVSKEAGKPHQKVIELFVQRQKIRVEYISNGSYQIQINGKILDKGIRKFQLKSIATILEDSKKEEVRVLCEIGLQLVIVRGTKIDVQVSPYFFNRTCGMCGDFNAEQYLDLKTPRGRPYTIPDKIKYGHMWMVPEYTCTKAGCHLKKEFVQIRKDINSTSHDCYPISPVLRCHEECEATKSKLTPFPMTCVETGSSQSLKIFKGIEKRTLDLTGSDVYFTENLIEHTDCDCSVCGY
ncbi:unnamed protein product, partial [Porites lobata]